jgi:hypothetical protein
VEERNLQPRSSVEDVGELTPEKIEELRRIRRPLCRAEREALCDAALKGVRE